MNKDFNKLLGAQIIRARQQQNLTQQQLAYAIGTSRQQVCNFETGRSVVSVEQLYLITTVFQIELVWLLPYKQDYKPRVKIPPPARLGARKPKKVYKQATIKL